MGSEEITGHKIGQKVWTAILLLIVLGFYLFTMQPSLAWGDGAKLQLEAVTGESFIFTDFPDEMFAHDHFPFAKLGVAAWDHPLYVVMGHTLVRLLPDVHALWLVNLLSVVFGAGSVIVLFRFLLEGTGRLWASTGVALLLAVSHTFWWHSATPEVYTLFIFLVLLTVYLYTQYERSSNIHYLWGAAFVLGLSAANHIMSFLVAPAFVLNYILKRERLDIRTLNIRKIFPTTLAFFTGASLLVVQSGRMLQVFPIGELLGPVVGSVFISQLLSTTVSDLLTSLISYLVFTFLQFGPLGMVLGIIGLGFARHTYAPLWRKTFSFYFVFAAFGVLYRVSDQFAFFLSAHVFFALAIGLGTAYLLDKMRIVHQKWVYISLIASIMVMPILYRTIPGIAASLNINDKTIGIPQIGIGMRNGLAYYMDPYKRGDRAPYDFGLETIAALPQDAFVVAQWYPDTDEYLILRYFAAVEGLRPDITVAGWTPVDPFAFDARIVVQAIEDEVMRRPVFLASLDVDFYQADHLMRIYCIAIDANLYRVYPFGPNESEAAQIDCLSDLDLLIYTFPRGN